MTLILTPPQPKAPPYIDVETAISTISRPNTVPVFYDPFTKQEYSYWTDSKKVYWRNFPISSDVENFVFYNSDFARDSKHCFVRQKKLRMVDYASFEVLSNCFARDDTTVWTGTGKLVPEDISTFEVYGDGITIYERNKVLSDGEKHCLRSVEFCGYARDSKAVYSKGMFENPRVVKKANPQTFVSSSCGCYGWDDKHIFWNHLIIKKADLKSWQVVSSKHDLSCDATNYFVQMDSTSYQGWLNFDFFLPSRGSRIDKAILEQYAPKS